VLGRTIDLKPVARHAPRSTVVLMHRAEPGSAESQIVMHTRPDPFQTDRSSFQTRSSGSGHDLFAPIWAASKHLLPQKGW